MTELPICIYLTVSQCKSLAVTGITAQKQASQQQTAGRSGASAGRRGGGGRCSCGALGTGRAWLRPSSRTSTFHCSCLRAAMASSRRNGPGRHRVGWKVLRLAIFAASQAPLPFSPALTGCVCSQAPSGRPTGPPHEPIRRAGHKYRKTRSQVLEHGPRPHRCVAPSQSWQPGCPEPVTQDTGLVSRCRWRRGAA
jgi:hypothetical protein